MRWTELAVYTMDEGIEHVAAAFTAIGVDQFSIEESGERIKAHLDGLAQYWDYADPYELAAKNGPCVKAYIADIAENERVLSDARAAVERLMASMTDIGTLRMVETSVDDEDWANSYKRYFKPIPIGERLLVCPPWDESGDLLGRTRLIIDPGMAFGTGDHHTTRLCLELMEKHIKNGDTVLDIGCGSGILSIGALLLGAERAVCADIDPSATRATKDNAAANGIDENRISAHTGDILHDDELIRRISGKYDMVFANIVADVVIALSSQVPRYLKEDGVFICSGIIGERERDVREVLNRSGLCVQKVLTSGGCDAQAPETPWVAIMAVR